MDISLFKPLTMKLLLCLFLIPYFFACKNKPFKPDFENAGGYVIGKEQCNTDTTLDYWLIDLSIFPLQNSYGDSLILNGITYRHVVKTTGLASQFKIIGTRVDFDFHLSSSLIQTVNCNVTPATYLLKEMQVLRQSELR